jgi:hypothetical protein
MKGQVSIEFFIYFGILLIVLAVLFTAAANKQVETFDYREGTHVSAVAQKVAFEVESAQAYGTGYEREFFLPRQVFGDEYSVNVTNGFVKVSSGNLSVTASARYSGREFSVKSDEGPFEVKNNGSVFIVPS